MMGAKFWDYSYSPRAAAFPEGREIFRWKRRAMSLGEVGFIHLQETSTFLLDCVSDCTVTTAPRTQVMTDFLPLVYKRNIQEMVKLHAANVEASRLWAKSIHALPLFLPSSWDTVSPGFFHILFFIYTLTFCLFLHFKEVFIQLLLLLPSINHIFFKFGGGGELWGTFFPKCTNRLLLTPMMLEGEYKG